MTTAARNHAGKDGTPDATTLVLRTMKQSRKNEYSSRELIDAFKGRLTPNELGDAVWLLIARGKVVVTYKRKLAVA
jgi:hypothetical protein